MVVKDGLETTKKETCLTNNSRNANFRLNAVNRVFVAAERESCNLNTKLSRLTPEVCETIWTALNFVLKVLS